MIWLSLAALDAAASIRSGDLRAADPRPALSGRELTHDAGRFRIHYADQGADAPPPDDEDGNGRPDLIDVLARQLPLAEAAYLVEGWRPLVGDDGLGGSAAIDVYVRELDAFGYAISAPSNGEGSSCFMEIDRGASIFGGIAASVATHELHHCIEFRYTTEAAGWLYEASATYEQYSHVTDPVLDAAAGILYADRLRSPERKLSAVDGRYEYAGFLWMKYWSERSGFRPDRLPALWEAIAKQPEWPEAFDTEGYAQFGADLPTVFLDYAVWNAFACGGDDGEHYLSDPIPCVLDETVPWVSWEGEQIEIAHGASPFTAHYLALPTDSDFTAVACDGIEGVRMAAVSMDADGNTINAARSDGERLVVPTVQGGTLRVVVAGTEEPLEATCIQSPVPRNLLAGCAIAPSGGAGVGVIGLGIVSLWGRVRRKRERCELTRASLAARSSAS